MCQAAQIGIENDRVPLLPRSDIPGVGNFAMISKGLYRGAQPTADGFATLKKMGIETVVNLRAFHSDRSKLKGTGLKYLHITCKAWRPKDDEVIEFLKIACDPAHQPVFVHCQHGADRTGMMVASYRIVAQSWSPDEAASELPRFGFHKIFPKVPRYVKAFAADVMKPKIKAAKAPTLETVK